MPDALYQFARRTLRQRRERGIARVAVGGPHTDLDQFVRGERTVEFGDDAVSEAGIAEHDERVQRVGETAQVFFLSFGECHRGIIGVPRA